MATDDERRAVAERLREMSGWGGEVDCADWGERVLNLLYRGGEDCTEGEYYARLADLIEPSCDRDALLALADEMQRDLDECASDHEIVGKLQYQIDHIREALGTS